MNDTTKIRICVGAGGVGKTTVASMLGCHHALLGEKTLLVTLDPARRLMEALSLAAKGDKPTLVDIAKITGKAPKNQGALYALMPDLQQEWKDFLLASIREEAQR